jgi:hypothetical protein
MAGTKCSKIIVKRLKDGNLLDDPRAAKVRAMAEALQIPQVVRHEA